MTWDTIDLPNRIIRLRSGRTKDKKEKLAPIINVMAALQPSEMELSREFKAGAASRSVKKQDQHYGNFGPSTPTGILTTVSLKTAGLWPTAERIVKGRCNSERSLTWIFSNLIRESD